MTHKMSKLTYVRLVMSGALAGVALFGVAAPLFGIDSSHAKDVLGGAVGATVVAVGFKLAHIA